MRYVIVFLDTTRHSEMYWMKKSSKWIWGGISFAGILLLFALGSCDKFLLKVGRYMAPVNDRMESAADVVVLESSEHVDRHLLARAASMVSLGKARRMVVVLHQTASCEFLSADLKAPLSVARKALDGLGLDETNCRVIITSSHHPVTLTAATEAMKILAGEGVRSVILVSPGFHTRRSYLVYQSIGAPFRIKIYPHASFEGDNHGLDKWWIQYHGVCDFIEQGLKLVYYMARGYIPPKLK
ncbi:MAG: hypothetical protein WCI03_08360 [bacterium]